MTHLSSKFFVVQNKTDLIILRVIDMKGNISNVELILSMFVIFGLLV
jgi:hypothetical protein